MIVVVTGGRDYRDAERLESVLMDLHHQHSIQAVYEGEASGADQMAARWARCNNVRLIPWPALWVAEGRKAGPLRNGRMLAAAKESGERLGYPVLVVAFPGGRGTADCVRQATDLGLDVQVVTP